MAIENCLKAAAVICAIAFLPAVSKAQTRVQIGTCSPTAVSDHSYARSSTQEATHLLNDMQYDARQVGNHARIMDNFTYHTKFAWDTTGIELRRIRWEINDMGKRLCKLERMQNAVPLAEQRAIQNVAPVVQEMADNADAAIHFRNAHHSGLWAPSFTANAQNLQTEAQTVIRQIHGSEKLAG
ncbi:MAG TPA: hypothetical protein VMH05_04795 [Bryobacteraceae bacterium]|nr:hypothetical protein [Bryobacteraceae bacterium]